MAFERGRFGVEYHARGREETHLLRWLLAVVAVLVLVAFACYKISTWRKAAEPERPRPRPAAEAKRETRPQPPAESVRTVPAARAADTRPPAPTNRAETAAAPAKAPADRPKAPVVQPPPKPREKAPSAPKLPPEAQALQDQILATMQARSANERVLLDRLVDAERRGNTELAVDAIKKLYARPGLADLKDPLLRRLGDLNMRLLLSGKKTYWTTLATVRRGDGLERIAREHRTTTAAVARLNPDVKWEKLKPGDTVRVLNFPSATLVVHKAGYADLSLNKNEPFFRRYYLKVSDAARSGIYPVEAGARARFRELGLRIAPADRAELEMFLAPGSRIIVSTDQ